MDNLEPRLTRCFLAVFPSLAPEDVPTATPETVDDWDSVAFVSLLTLVEEEFGVELDLDRLEELTSFVALGAYLQTTS